VGRSEEEKESDDDYDEGADGDDDEDEAKKKGPTLPTKPAKGVCICRSLLVYVSLFLFL